MHPLRYLPRPVPEPLAGLVDLALDLRWSWDHHADRLWQQMDVELWESTCDPWLILESVSQQRLEDLAGDQAFIALLREQVAVRREYLERQPWYSRIHGADTSLGTVAYFSMEFGLSEALPIYSGGLGVLAGDLLKTASDLGVPLVGIGLLYQQGYFHQVIDASGQQLEFYPFNNPAMLPVLPLRDATGGWLQIVLDLPGRILHLRGWEARIGRVSLYLLDSNDLRNAPGDRGITSGLYSGGPELRLQQEMVLGIGGWRLLEALGVNPDICHLNEGHAAFAPLERARSFMADNGCSFHEALRCTRSGNLFTTHTPVAAGFDHFAPELVTQYLQAYVARLGISVEDLLTLGRASNNDPLEPLNMAYLAMRCSGAVNGVSRLHATVSQEIFQPLFPRWPVAEVPVGYVTNGVHVPSWDSAAADALWTAASGRERWLGDLRSLEQAVHTVSDEELWRTRTQGRQALVQAVHRRQCRQEAACGYAEVQFPEVLDPNILTLGFARRFAAYKRPDLLLHDPQRLTRLLIDTRRPVQLVIAGKAHPQDQVGRRLINRWVAFARQPAVHGRVVFLEDYDLALATDLVQGVDVWINTPRRPWEASGTSGMKVLVNGGLNVSELDGWWAEAWSPEVGWALGDRREHDADPAWDAAEADELYRLLEEEVVPEFYERNENGLPAAWLARIRKSMARLTPRFSSNRMLREYVEDYYLPAAAVVKNRCADGGALGISLESRLVLLTRHWNSLRFGTVTSRADGGALEIEAQIYFDDISPDLLEVELYAEPLAADDAPERIPMAQSRSLPGAVQGFVYRAVVGCRRPAEHYTPRVMAAADGLAVPLEAPWILWQR
ncbi:MAG: alpha-glucan family phosphorylase [Deltaproteobacteria bacterium]|nr:alpha-glucan family phosphorylase [Candidatus Anaeroferrophillus wilburensis]MBN2888009.1 alpha-glucan family phosphorylase [Deltaproteobacteria bacterium]